MHEEGRVKTDATWLVMRHTLRLGTTVFSLAPIRKKRDNIFLNTAVGGLERGRGGGGKKEERMWHQLSEKSENKSKQRGAGANHIWKVYVRKFELYLNLMSMG